MAGPWDSLMKRLVAAKPRQIAQKLMQTQAKHAQGGCDRLDNRYILEANISRYEGRVHVGANSSESEMVQARHLKPRGMPPSGPSE